MSIQDWGAIGEILGAIGVILTLLYLASQLRQNTKAMKSATLQAYSAATLSSADSFSGCAEELAKLQRGEELAQAEKLKLQYVFVKVFAQMETTYLQHKQKNLDTEVFEARMNGFKRFLQGPLAREAWDFFKLYDLTPSFTAYVDNTLLDDT